jgi:hypothetical protein
MDEPSGTARHPPITTRRDPISHRTIHMPTSRGNGMHPMIDIPITTSAPFD